VVSATPGEQQGSRTQIDYEDQNQDEEDENAAGRSSDAAFSDGLPDDFAAIAAVESERARVDSA
jgi:hypothetical protein